ncbi:MAG: hypothetical protein ACP5QX_07270 [Caldisericaceae bacterium]
MKGLISEEELAKLKELAKKAQEDTSELAAVANEELRAMNDVTFENKVCRTTSARITHAKEGDIIYQCGYANRDYFDRVNSNKAMRGDRADIYMTIIGAIKAAIPCPRAGSDMCLLKNYKKEREK